MNPKTFDEEQNNKVSYIESVIKKFLPLEEGYQKTIFEAMNYSILAGGKRLRPMFLLETYKMFGGTDNTWIEPFMASMEMIHTYSLVHDDLPAMDNDEYRRGRKTTHVVYGEAMGILAGDGLLNYAFETACKAFSIIPVEHTIRVAKAIEVLSKKAGIYGMIGGQVIDIEGFKDLLVNRNQINLTETEKENIKIRLDSMYSLKTSALVEGSMMIGAILAGADENEIKVVEDMANHIGLAFQIQDDILDVTSTTEVLGKPIHSDERNEKITYVSLFGLEKAKKEVEDHSAKSLAAFEVLQCENDFLRDLIIKLITREK
jgi:geranylgeranyl diphosphate synthase type II